MLERIADAEGENVVACIPDQALADRPVPNLNDHFEPGRMLQSFADDWSVDVKRGSGWIEVKPYDGFLDRKERLLRAPLGELVRGIVERNRLDLPALANYASVQLGTLCLCSIDADLLGLAPSMPGDYSPREQGGVLQRGLLRFWNAIGAPVQVSKIRLDSSAESQRFSEWLFGWQPKLGGALLVPNLTPPDASYVLGNIGAEPSEFCPAGLPSSVNLTCTPETEPLLSMRTAQNQEDFASKPFDWGWTVASMNSGADPDPAATFVVGGAYLINLHFEIDRRATIDGQLGDQNPGWSAPVRFEDLPIELRNEFKRGADKARAEKRPAKGDKPPPSPTEPLYNRPINADCVHLWPKG